MISNQNIIKATAIYIVLIAFAYSIVGSYHTTLLEDPTIEFSML